LDTFLLVASQKKPQAAERKHLLHQQTPKQLIVPTFRHSQTPTKPHALAFSTLTRALIQPNIVKNARFTQLLPLQVVAVVAAWSRAQSLPLDHAQHLLQKPNFLCQVA